MLRLRVITAVVLLVVLVAALWLGRIPFVLVAGVLIGAAAFEWLRLAGLPDVGAGAGGSALAAVLIGLELTGATPQGQLLLLLCMAASVLWAALFVVLLKAAHGAVHLPRLASVLLCLVALPAAWFALLALHREGLVLLLSALCIVWVADIAAYFVGRAFGKRKLAPQISPGKTWAGVVGAVVGVLAIALIAHAVWPRGDLFTNRLLERAPIVLAIVLLALLVAVSIVGDLFESLIKRLAGKKDSSGLLPGHGGVLDRIDALIPVLPAALLIERWIQ